MGTDNGEKAIFIHFKQTILMTGFVIKTADRRTIRFRYYLDDAPATAEAFDGELPFTRTLVHARVSGREIWAEAGPSLDIIQENASVFVTPGEVVLGPTRPARVRTSGALGIYYGEGKGLDSCNIFAKVYDEDMHILASLGDEIWRHGESMVSFEK